MTTTEIETKRSPTTNRFSFYNFKGKGGRVLPLALGVLFTFAIALLGYGWARIPGFDRIGQMACAILLAVAYRHFFGYPQALRSGIVFSSQRLLRLAIVLYGLKLNIGLVLGEGLGLLAKDALVIGFAIGLTLLLARLMKADRDLSLLLGIGTGICGAAAVAAIAPIVDAKEEDTAAGVGMIALLGTIWAIGYTLLRPLLPLSDLQYGAWTGMSLHEVAHVALAGTAGGADGLAIALLAKLGRVFLLLPVSLIFLFIMKRKNRAASARRLDDANGPISANGSESAEKSKASAAPFPWFLVGFLLMSLLGSFLSGHSIPAVDGWLAQAGTLTTWLLTAAMVGLGLNVNLRDLRTRALRPLAVMTIVSTALSIFTFCMI
ncbi:YeiH family protein [Saccharibacillus sp. O23]|uniref:YeiH family protein n=1 Tax=Saccharibacillus sp. O23 TaxID=2009338 RepID=UPI00211B62C7|nr:putative sulfate exporter family transporter [Saccharibacillus sp. O23]